MVRRARYLTSAALGLVLLGTPGLYAELILHHGETVEAQGGVEECVVCHDGLIAPRADFCLANCSFHSSHAVDRPYPSTRRGAGYASVETLQAAGIRLVGGRVVCISCHDLSRDQPYHLAVANNGSQLCLTCHIK